MQLDFVDGDLITIVGAVNQLSANGLHIDRTTLHKWARREGIELFYVGRTALLKMNDLRRYVTTGARAVTRRIQ
jgi:hypothetical protein